MNRALAAAVAAVVLTGAAPKSRADWLKSSPALGKAEAQCAPAETGPAVLVLVTGLKDRTGRLKAELYPANDDDFLADDNQLLMAEKVFRRVEVTLQPSGPVQLCLRVPGPGAYALSVLHDRDANRKFGLSTDGAGFSRNPRLGLAKPKAAAVTFAADAGLTQQTIVMNYRRGLFRFGPLKD